MNNKIRSIVFTAMVSVAATAFAQGSAEANYKAKCLMCHAADGSGSTPAGKSMKTPSFSSPEVAKKSDADLFSATKNGVGKMPAYAGKLSDGDIKDLVAYIHTLQKK